MRLPLFLAAIGAFALAGSGCESTSDNALVGSAPDFQLESLQSSAVQTDLKSERGKPVLLDFWATWCGPCKQLTPYVESIYEKYKDKGLQAMAISNEDRKTVQAFEAQTPHKMPVYLDASEVASATLKVEGLPTVVLIDKQGKVVYIKTGLDPVAVHEQVQELDDDVAKALAG